MKFIASFKKFIEDEVDLNKDRRDRIDKGITVVGDFLKADQLFKDHFISLEPQGSVRQGTTIKPINENDFDVDLLYRVKPFDGWEPKDYPEKLHQRFKGADRYKDIVDKRGKTRCVTLDYESDFHIDIVPCVEINGVSYIMNRTENEFEPTDADGYSEWFASQNKKAGNDYFINSVKLAKYLRDRTGIPMKSVLLTTILGNQILEGDSTLFTDLPTAFSIVFSRLDYFLQQYSTPPVICNPVLESENFNRHWDQKGFEDSKKQIHSLKLGIEDAFSELDGEKSLDKWRKIFGDDFPLCDEDIGKAIAPSVVFSLGNTAHCLPVAAIPGCAGESLDGTRVRIDGYLYSKDGSKKFRGINSEAKIGSDLSIRYIAKSNAREPYEIYWQVVNTGQHATGLGLSALRGGFAKARLLGGQENSNKHSNWEHSLYTGKHWIECFVLKDGYCTARSGRFYINIKNPSY